MPQRVGALVCAVVFLALARPVAADQSIQWVPDIARFCVPLGIPVELVRAIMLVESAGRPYAMNMTLKGTSRAYFAPNAEAAAAWMDVVLKETLNVDIGLMQVNWRAWHRHYPGLPAALIAPLENIQVGCEILALALDGDGPIVSRIGRYHSRTPWRRDAYGRRVLDVVSTLLPDSPLKQGDIAYETHVVPSSLSFLQSQRPRPGLYTRSAIVD